MDDPYVLCRDACYATLMAHAHGDHNDDAIARMCASWMAGRGVLPYRLGLPEPDYADLMGFHFPGYFRPSGPPIATAVDASRLAELGDLTDLLQKHRSGSSCSELRIACIVAVACLGRDHLWEDLGLWCRADLSALLYRNFRALAEKNVDNMRWKRFLYKQLCETDSVYACRVPSCEYCADYLRCFCTDEDDDGRHGPSLI